VDVTLETKLGRLELRPEVLPSPRFWAQLCLLFSAGMARTQPRLQREPSQTSVGFPSAVRCLLFLIELKTPPSRRRHALAAITQSTHDAAAYGPDADDGDGAHTRPLLPAPTL
jgi:hypothetical protein